MDFDEGSTEVDDGILPVINNNESEEDEIEVRDDDKGEVEETPSTEGEGEVKKPELSDKGTKLDEDPLSRANQQLANERTKVRQYEKVLSDPVLLRRFAKEAGMTLEEAKAEIKEEVKATYAPERFKSSQDVADALNELHGNFSKTVNELKEENKSLREELSGLSSSRQVERVATAMQSDVVSVREKYPQLDPKSPEYDSKLEKEIGSFYHELDAVDPNDPSLGYKGQFSLAKIADRFMRVRGVGAKEGSRQAQTIVKVRESGRVVTSSKGASKEESNSSNPGTSIAQKVKKALEG